MFTNEQLCIVFALIFSAYLVGIYAGNALRAQRDKRNAENDEFERMIAYLCDDGIAALTFMQQDEEASTVDAQHAVDLVCEATGWGEKRFYGKTRRVALAKAVGWYSENNHPNL